MRLRFIVLGLLTACGKEGDGPTSDPSLPDTGTGTGDADVTPVDTGPLECPTDLEVVDHVFCLETTDPSYVTDPPGGENDSWLQGVGPGTIIEAGPYVALGGSVAPPGFTACGDTPGVSQMVRWTDSATGSTWTAGWDVAGGRGPTGAELFAKDDWTSVIWFRGPLEPGRSLSNALLFDGEGSSGIRFVWSNGYPYLSGYLDGLDVTLGRTCSADTLPGYVQNELRFDAVTAWAGEEVTAADSTGPVEILVLVSDTRADCTADCDRGAWMEWR